MQNIFLALSLKYKVSAHDQIAISSYNLLTKFYMEKIGPFFLWSMKLIGDAFNLIM